MKYTATEENYIKAIYHLTSDDEQTVSTNRIAAAIEATPASVTDMLKKLKLKKLITYERYKGVRLTKAGELMAKAIVRKHRLWEVFLVEKLGYTWDQIHDIAEQLEHIQSEDLINKLDVFLGYPKTDPHGDPIPDATGKLPVQKQILLSTLVKNNEGTVVGVKDSSPKFLQHLTDMGIKLGTVIKVADIAAFDGTVRLSLDGKKSVTVSQLVARNIFIG